MGRIFTVYFDGNQCYCICRNCSTHIALMDSYFECTTNIFPEENGTFFKNAVNMHVDGSAPYRQVGVHTVAEIYCVTCGDKLGWKCIQADKEQDLRSHALREGNVRLITRKLLWRIINQTPDAGTNSHSGNSVDPDSRT